MSDYVEVKITKGGTFERAFNVTDVAGEALGEGWVGRLEVRTRYGGSPVFVFADAAEEEVGTLTIIGLQCVLELPSAVTETLPATVDSSGSNSVHYVGDVEFWDSNDPADPPKKYKPGVPFRFYIAPEVTTT